MRIIHDMLRVKAHREHQAEQALAKASQALNIAIKHAEVAKRKLEQAHMEHNEKKRALYEDLFSRVVHLSDLDLARSKIEKMDANIKDCETEVSSSEERLASMEEMRDESRAAYRNALREREKYAELSLQLIKKEQKKLAKKEEMELEEAIRSQSRIVPSEVAAHGEDER